MTEVKVAIIDDCFREVKVAGHSIVRPSHGLICLRYFKAFAHQQNVSLVPTVSSPNEQAPVECMVHALSALKKARPDLVVMSMGTTNPLVADQLVQEAFELVQRDVVIVCACSNEDIVSFPASIPGIIGVRNDRQNILQAGFFSYIDNPIDGIDVVASPLSLPNTRIKPASNSLAAQYVGALICNIMCKDGIRGISSIRAALTQQSVAFPHDFSYYQRTLNNGNCPHGGTIRFVGDAETAEKIAARLSVLFARDGYSIGTVTQAGSTEITKLWFALQDSFPHESISRKEKISFLFQLAKIDLLFLLPDVGEYPADVTVLVSATEIGNATFSADCSDCELMQGYLSILAAFD